MSSFPSNTGHVTFLIRRLVFKCKAMDIFIDELTFYRGAERYFSADVCEDVPSLTYVSSIFGISLGQSLHSIDLTLVSPDLHDRSGKVGGGPAGWTPGVRSPANLLASELCATDAPTARKDGAPAGDAQLLWPRPLLCTARLRTLVVAATHVLDAAAGRTGGRRARPAAVVMRVRGVLMQLLEQRPPAGPGADLPVLDHITVQLQVSPRLQWAIAWETFCCNSDEELGRVKRMGLG
jgi:hypothetical protein